MSGGKEMLKYLRCWLSAKGVATDEGKVEAIKTWPGPSNVKDLCNILGLAGFMSIAWLWTQLMKKNAFNCSPAAHTTFLALKEALISTPVLALPNFSQPFVVETNASGKGLWDLYS